MTQATPSKSTQPERLLRLPELQSRVGLGKSSIYEKVRQGTFPRPVKLSRRAVCWPASAVDAWIAERINGGDQLIPGQAQPLQASGRGAA